MQSEISIEGAKPVSHKFRTGSEGNIRGQRKFIISFRGALLPKNMSAVFQFVTSSNGRISAQKT